MNPVVRWFHQLGSPPYFDRFARRWAPWAYGLAILVFGAGSVAAAGQGLDPTGALLLLAAGLVLALVLAPLAAAAAIRIALD